VPPPSVDCSSAAIAARANKRRFVNLLQQLGGALLRYAFKMRFVDAPPHCVPAAWHRYWTSAAEAPKVLFHYTSAAAAAAILTSRQMWATDLLFTDDPTELTYAASVISIALDDAIAAVGDDTSRRTWLDSFRRLAKNRARENSWYAISFCAHGDLLSQWRSYADSGGGFALGFSCNSLSTLRAWILPIEYDHQQQLQLARDLIAIHMREVGHHVDLDHESARDDFIRTSNSLLFFLSLLLLDLSMTHFRRRGSTAWPFR